MSRLAFGLALLVCPGVYAEAQPPSSSLPSLIVLLTVDQLRADYLIRFHPQLSGGFARFTRAGLAILKGAGHSAMLLTPQVFLRELLARLQSVTAKPTR